VEVANVLRRSVITGQISADTAALAHSDLLSLSVGLYSYEPFAARVWQLRENVTAYDAWYVALAESLEAPLATLDRKLAQTVGPRCAFTTP
jgi:predicted nucleic acid-binding protein